MAGRRRTPTQRLAESIAGQHLALSVAAHLARSQLISDPHAVYDSQHLNEMLDLVATALARNSPLYVLDAQTGVPRQLTAAELHGAEVRRGATVLQLKDGRALAGVSIRRGELRQAIAILKTIGLHEIAPQYVPAEPGPASEQRGAGDEHLLERLDEMEALLAPPLIAERVEKAKATALFIARHARHGRVANLSMQLMSSLHDARAVEDVPGGFRMGLARLRAALEQQNV